MLSKILALPKNILEKYLIGVLIGVMGIIYILFGIFRDEEVRKDIAEFGLSADIILWLGVILLIVLVSSIIGWILFIRFWTYTNKKIGSLERLIIFNINTICLLIIFGLTIARVSKYVEISDQTYLTGISGLIILALDKKNYLLTLDPYDQIQ